MCGLDHGTGAHDCSERLLRTIEEIRVHCEWCIVTARNSARGFAFFERRIELPLRGIHANHMDIELISPEAADGAVIETVIYPFPLSATLAVRAVLFFFEVFAVR